MCLVAFILFQAHVKADNVGESSTTGQVFYEEISNNFDTKNSNKNVISDMGYLILLPGQQGQEGTAIYVSCEPTKRKSMKSARKGLAIAKKEAVAIAHSSKLRNKIISTLDNKKLSKKKVKAILKSNGITRNLSERKYMVNVDGTLDIYRYKKISDLVVDQTKNPYKIYDISSLSLQNGKGVFDQESSNEDINKPVSEEQIIQYYEDQDSENHPNGTGNADVDALVGQAEDSLDDLHDISNELSYKTYKLRSTNIKFKE